MLCTVVAGGPPATAPGVGSGSVRCGLGVVVDDLSGRCDAVVLTETLAAPLGAAAREVLAERLGAVFCDEDVPRGGWGWLAPDRRVTVADADGVPRVTVWRCGELGTDDEWVSAVVRDALVEAGVERV